MANIKIATYNVNSVRARLQIIIPWLLEHTPDVLCMQETKVSDEKFPVSSFAEIGYHASFSGAGRYNGVAIATRQKPQNVSVGFSSSQADQDRIIVADFVGLKVINIYVPQGREKDSPHFAHKLEWFARFYEMSAASFNPQDNLIVCGDLNVAPTALDVHNPKRLLGHVCFTPEVWAAYEQWHLWGLHDVFRKCHPEKEGQFSFFDYRVPDAVDRGLGWRVDHILATKSLYDKALECWIDVKPRLAEKPSDHTPVMASFAL